MILLLYFAIVLVGGALILVARGLSNTANVTSVSTKHVLSEVPLLIESDHTARDPTLKRFLLGVHPQVAVEFVER